MKTAPRILALGFAAHFAGGAVEARQIGGGPPPSIEFRQVVAVGKADQIRNVREVDIAVSLDGGATFTNVRLAGLPDEPALQSESEILIRSSTPGH